ncbi:MAG: preprotein translocase subunit SecY, partial [Gammaproteobacteria bacterium]|nr:preprotein translocase subunit SecY [Gammaproteobacteria bacterium]
MLSVFAKAFRTPDLRRKIFFTLAIMALFRFGSVVPTPGVSYAAVQRCLDKAETGGLFGLINLFSGGALLKLSVFALGIMPYITASIIIQLLTVVIPRFETLKKEGQSGTAKLTQYTRYLTVGLAILQTTGLIAVARTPGRLINGCNEPIIPDTGWLRILTMIFVMTAGTSVIMWLGELITDRGVGNGMSILIFTSIAASFPAQLWSIKLARGWVTFLFIIAIGFAIIAAVVFVEQSQRRIPVQYAKRQIGRRQYGGTTTYIPIKVNQSGVIPVIFASSLLYIPSLIVNFTNSTAPWAVWIQSNFVKGDHPYYILSYALLIIFFCYFYVAITFNPEETAENMRKYGGFIP